MKAVLYRLVRSIVAVVAGTLVAKFQNDPRYLWLAPLIQAAGKALRVRWPALADVLPF